MSIHCNRFLSSERTKRKPRLLLRLDGELLLRLDTRQFLALLFQLPPRFTRLDPLADLYLISLYTLFLKLYDTAWFTNASKGNTCSLYAVSSHTLFVNISLYILSYYETFFYFFLSVHTYTASPYSQGYSVLHMYFGTMEALLSSAIVLQRK